jgi:hypothetical protein
MVALKRGDGQHQGGAIAVVISSPWQGVFDVHHSGVSLVLDVLSEAVSAA